MGIEVKRVYTDGASSPDGRGGWGWVLESDFSVYDSGYDWPTTNQRMELTAALRAVEAFPEGPLVVISDSAYVVNCFRDRWWVKWERKNWMKSATKPVANPDLWKPLVALYKRHPGLVFEWVKGHSGHPANERADVLAVRAKGFAEGMKTAEADNAAYQDRLPLG